MGRYICLPWEAMGNVEEMASLCASYNGALTWAGWAVDWRRQPRMIETDYVKDVADSSDHQIYPVKV